MCEIMDFRNESIALGIDLLILGVFCIHYINFKKRQFIEVNLDAELKELVARQENKRIPYVIISGKVVPIGSTIRSAFSPSITGVIQIIKLREHKEVRDFPGFWTEELNLIDVKTNESPFMIKNGENGVQILGDLSTAALNLEVVYNKYVPCRSIFDYVGSFFSGVKQKGLQTTEEMLRDDSIITAIGEIELNGDNLCIHASNVGPLVLTTATKSTMLEKYEEVKSVLRGGIVLCSIISAILLGIIARKFYRKKKEEQDRRRTQEIFVERREGGGGELRARSRERNLYEDQICVVCAINPKEVIILPCGHVCLCKYCSERIRSHCPICRRGIVSTAAAFIS